MLRAQLEADGLRGCVLETYGSGNAPTALGFSGPCATPPSKACFC
ncbi:hypothetical protein [Hymenobacter sp. 5516J-16]|nr:hypothetical protein [Hymenobacter sp. 5516J-16]